MHVNGAVINPVALRSCRGGKEQVGAHRKKQEDAEGRAASADATAVHGGFSGDQACTPMDGSPFSRPSETRVVRSQTDFAEVWPLVHASLFRWLRRRGADRETAEDVCQDVAVAALRAISRGQTFDSVAHLNRRVRLIANRRLIDQWRRKQVARRGAVLLRSEPEGMKIDELVVQRAAIDELTAAIAELPADLRESLVGVDGEDPLSRTSAESTTRRWRRQLARERLRGMVRNFPAGIPVLGYRVRQRLALWTAGQGSTMDLAQVIAGLGVSIAILVGPPVAERGAQPPHASAQRASASPSDAELTAAVASASAKSAAASHASAPSRSVDRVASSSPPSGPYWKKTRDIASVSNPFGEAAAVSAYEEPPDRPLACAQVEPTPEVCVYHDDVPTAPQLPGEPVPRP